MTEQIKIDFDKVVKTSGFSEEEIKLKRNYLNKFIESGFPNRKLENWKFSDMNQIIQKNIGELDFYSDYSSSNKIDTSIFIDELEHNKIFFINGRVEKIDFSYEDENKVKINENSKLDSKFDNNNSLLDLNNAFTNKSYKILIKKDYSFRKPLIVYHTTNDKIKSKNINLRLEFQLEENSSLRLIDYFNDNKEKNFINIFYNFDLKKNSVLKNYKIDKTINKNVKYSFNNIDQDTNSVSETFILSSGSNFLKNEIATGMYPDSYLISLFNISTEISVFLI